MKRFYISLLLALMALPMMAQNDVILTTDNHKFEVKIIAMTPDTVCYNMAGAPITFSLPMSQVADIVFRTGDTVHYNAPQMKLVENDTAEEAVSATAAKSPEEPVFDVDIAAARQFHGIYVFTDCKPLDEYQVLGVVTYSETKGSVATTTYYSSINLGTSAATPIYAQYTSLRNGLVRRALEAYPNAQGIIIEADGQGSAIARVISFKEEREYRLARVIQLKGYYIYIDNSPTVSRYIHGSVSALFGESTYTSVRNKLMGKAASQYRKKGNALVFSFVEGGADFAYVMTLEKSPSDSVN